MLHVHVHEYMQLAETTTSSTRSNSMFGRLPESRAKPQFRIGGTFVSVTIHALMIAGVVALTANAHVAAPDPVVERLAALVDVSPPPPPPARQPPRVASASATPVAAGTPSLVAPITVPLDLPPIQLSATALSDDVLSRTPRGIVGGATSGNRAAVGALLPNQPFTAEQVDKPVLLRPGSPAPTYPEYLRRAGITGTVTVEFVVDTLGRIDLESIRVRGSDHEQLTGSVRATLPRLRFLPAEFQGRKVPQLVQLPFRFDITP